MKQLLILEGKKPLMKKKLYHKEQKMYFKHCFIVVLLFTE